MVALEVKCHKCCYESTHCSLDTACSQLEENEKQVYEYKKPFERLRERFPKLMLHKSKV